MPPDLLSVVMLCMHVCFTQSVSVLASGEVLLFPAQSASILGDEDYYRRQYTCIFYLVSTILVTSVYYIGN